MKVLIVVLLLAPAVALAADDEAAARHYEAGEQSYLRGNYRGQKQIWYLLRLVGRDSDVRLRGSSKPEFDAWRWSDYWVPMESVIEFKREVYQRALEELAPYLKRRTERRPRVQRAAADALERG